MSDLQNTTGLIPIRERDGQQAVSGRELHEFLEIETAYNVWFNRMLAYGFEDFKDFQSILIESSGGRPGHDHALSLDMAKELSMIQRSAKGKEARQYFIEVEKRFQAAIQPAVPKSLPEALRAYAEEVERSQQLEAKISEDAPKVLFADSVATSDTDVLVGDMAKILKGNGVEVGANRFFEWLRRDGFLIRRRGTDWNMPTQRAMELGLFRVKETAVTHSDGRVTLSKTPKVTGKGQTYFVKKYLPMKELANV